MTAKPRDGRSRSPADGLPVPRTIDGFCPVKEPCDKHGHEDMAGECFEPCNECNFGRFVPDDLLRERFAFEGQKVVPADAVVLTPVEAKRIWNFVDKLSSQLNAEWSTHLTEAENKEVEFVYEKLAEGVGSDSDHLESQGGGE